MTTQLRSRTKKTITLQDQKALIIEMEELIKSQNEFIQHDAIFFCNNNIYYRVYFSNIGNNIIDPCYEYKVTRSNCEKFFHPTKKDRKLSVINNNYDSVWIEEFYYYPVGHNINYYTLKDYQIDYVKKQTFWLDGDCNITLK
jgi:hypothetical protein